MPDNTDLSADAQSALDIARGLIEAGVAVFAASPCPAGCELLDKKNRPHRGGPGRYHLPKEWEKTYPSLVNLDRWRPGWALGAVGGRVADFLDVDPRANGHLSLAELAAAGHMPLTFGRQRTPSGGDHYLIAATGERKETGFMSGLDLQAGEFGNGQGRGFVYIAPTVRRSKDPANLGELVAYEWIVPPDMAALQDAGQSARDSTEGIISRVLAHRTKPKPERAAPLPPLHDPDDPFLTASQVAGFGFGREFTLAEAQNFVRPSLLDLQQAKIGRIEETANIAAATLYHFVPAFWSVSEAMGLIEDQLALTDYDPNGPSEWDSSKFHDVLDGTRPPHDQWKAARKADPAASPVVTIEAAPGEESLTTVERLRRRMVTAEQMSLRPTPKPLVHGLLDLNTEAWLIGAPGSLKSFVALDLAGHIGRGAAWQGHRVERHDVLYIAAEGEGGMVLRTRAWIKQHGGMPGVTFLPYPVQVKSSDGQWDALVQIATEDQPGLIVIDTQARVSVGLEENSATDMGVLISAIGRLKRATGACILVIHHTGRNGGDARGSSALDGAQDTEIKVVRSEPRPDLMCKLVQDKQKDMSEGSASGVPLRMRVVDLGIDPETGRELSSLVVDPDADAIDRYMREREGFTAEEIEPWKGKSPEPWTKHVAGVEANATVQRRILQVLADHAHDIGLTESKARAAVVARWYPDSARGGGAKLDKSNWINAWGVVASTDIAVSVGGERWALDQPILKLLKESHPL